MNPPQQVVVDCPRFLTRRHCELGLSRRVLGKIATQRAGVSMYRCIVIMLVACWSLGVPDADAAETSAKDAIMANPGSFAAQVESQIQNDDGQQSPALQSVQRLVAPSAQWRFYARGQGVLIAIPVRRRLLAQEEFSGEAAVKDIVERMIRQRDLTGSIEVVFIEPTPPPSAPPAPPCVPACEPLPCHCGHK
jgi:hypothetical protein